VGLEVSCRALEPFLAITQAQGLDLERLTEGLSIPPGCLTSGSASISWEAFVLLTERVERLIGGPEQMAEAGTRVMDVPGLRRFAHVIALFADIQRVYAASDRFSRKRLFRCLQTTFEVVAPTHIRTTVTIPAPYTPSRAFFSFLAGVFRATPRVLGMPDSVVRVRVEGNRCTYDVHHAPSATLWTRLRQGLRVLFSARHALAELELQNRELMTQLGTVAEAQRVSEATSRHKSEFLATMSHEIRTPLNAVVGALNLLQETPLDPEQQEHVQVVRQGAEDLVDVVQRVLDFADLDAGRLSLVHRPFDLRAAVRSVQTILQPMADAKGLDFKVSVDPAIPVSVLGDRLRVQQILRNILDNALKFSRAGEVRLEARTMGDATPATVEFQIRDTGPGIPIALRRQIFEPFVQQDGSLTRRHDGSGLGLTIAHQLTRLMGGQIEVESVVGQGSTFSLTIPLPPATDSVAAAEVSVDIVRPPVAVLRRPSAPPAPVPAQRPPVLVVEDNPVNQRILEKMLARLGHTFITAADGLEAVQRVREARFGLILMDCQMPNMDGLEATRVIRRMGEGRGDVAVVAVTANASPGHREECLAAGMNDYLLKPMKMDVLEDVLQRYLPDSLPAPAPDDAARLAKR
jgi:signal transduction histidine kinase/CheY-like chemotaxis protein